MSLGHAAVQHHAIHRRIVCFSIELVCRTGLHIGAGKSGDLVGSQLPVIRDDDGRPLIPGSSLRGILRTGCEGLVRGLGVEKGLRRVADAPDCPTEMVEGWKSIGLIDRLFGRIGDRKNKFAYASRLKISSLTCIESEAIELRDGVGIDRESRTAAQGAKFDLEIVPAGARFQGRIKILNPADHELGLLAQALMMLDEGMLHLGGCSARGLGWMEVKVGQLRDWTAEGLLDGSSQQRQDVGDELGPVQERLKTYSKAFVELAKLVRAEPAGGA